MPVSVKPIVFAAAALLLVVALWRVFSPQASERPVPVASNPSRTIFDLEIKDGKLASRQSVIQVHRGEQVVLRFKSNTADELHLHGYDLYARITPQETAVLEFNANRTGRFTLELHEAQTELGALEVYPR
jgi:hypothetical protein